MEIPIKNICLIQIFAKCSVVKKKPPPGTTFEVQGDIEVTSLIERTFEKYRELYNIVLDFFNFYIYDDVDLVSVTGVYKDEFGTLKDIEILYRYPDLRGLNKPRNNVNFYMEGKYCLWIPRILSEWFELQLEKNLEAVFNLYMGVMVSGSDWFLEFQFLALAQALEVYHSLTIGDASIFRKGRI